jgi:hypothetical protein
MKISFAALFAFAIVLASTTALAGPSSSDVDELFGNFGLEGGGFFGTGSLGSAAVSGGDGHVVLEAAPGALLIGSRFGSDLKSTQFATFDAGIRYFVKDDAVTALFVGGGGFYGAEYVSSFKFEIGNLAGAYGEVGYETPRDQNARVILSLRADLGGTQQRDISRVEPAPVYGVLSLNLSVLVGGDGTKRERHNDKSVQTAPQEVPIQP